DHGTRGHRCVAGLRGQLDLAGAATAAATAAVEARSSHRGNASDGAGPSGPAHALGRSAHRRRQRCSTVATIAGAIAVCPAAATPAVRREDARDRDRRGVEDDQTAATATATAGAAVVATRAAATAGENL